MFTYQWIQKWSENKSGKKGHYTQTKCLGSTLDSPCQSDLECRFREENSRCRQVGGEYLENLKYYVKYLEYRFREECSWCRQVGQEYLEYLE